MIGGTSGFDLALFVVSAVVAGTATGLFMFVWRAGHTRGRLEAELACCRAKGTDDVKSDLYKDLGEPPEQKVAYRDKHGFVDESDLKAQAADMLRDE